MNTLLRTLFKTPARPTRRRAALTVEQLNDRLLPSVSPVAPAFDVSGQDHHLGLDPSSMGERSVGRAANGNFVAVWESADANTGGVYYRLFDTAGKPLTGATLVEGTDNTATQATVGMSSTGTFAVTWVTGGAIYVQRFDAAGNYVGHINPVATAGTFYNPSVALNYSGMLAVAYDAYDPNTGDMDINLWTQSRPDTVGQYYQAGVDSGGGNASPSVALNDCGRGALAFTVHDATGTGLVEVAAFTPGSGIDWARLDLHQGEAEYTSGEVSVAYNNADHIVVAYTNTYYSEPGFRGPIADSQVIAERWGPSAAFLGAQTVLHVPNSGTGPEKSREYHPSVAEDADGNFVVAARQEYSTYSAADGDYELAATPVVAALFDASGNSLTGTFGVSSTADNPVLHTQDKPGVAMDGKGNFVIAFDDENTQGSALYARLFTHTSDGVNGFVALPPAAAPAAANVVLGPKALTAHAGHAFGLRVRLLDGHGHAVKAGTKVHLQLASGHLAGHLTVKTDKHGFAVFTGLRAARAGHYTLLATVPGFTASAALRLHIVK